MSDSKIIQVLRENGYSITAQRRRVFDYLQNMDEPISVSKLSSHIDNVDKVSVYRIIELFEKIGIVHRIWTGFKSKIELSDIFSSHHHHFTCVKCGATISLTSEPVERELHKLEAQYNFKLTHHSVELAGYCDECRGIK